VSSITQNRRVSGFTCVTGMLQAAQAAGRLLIAMSVLLDLPCRAMSRQ
jgi:hypothetical protein